MQKGNATRDPSVVWSWSGLPYPGINTTASTIVCSSGSRTACLMMVFKLTQSAEKNWRALNGSESIPDVIAGVRFVDGEKEDAA